ncbi:MAG TPA: hypothetical protein VGH54_23495 [Mycobacterium sp.]|jgi:hypothetical protein|uniref:hypothetical protein n=1 Tax=Mycobacterium sp. TaxID=1785 RepID=UPI002F4271A2
MTNPPAEDHVAASEEFLRMVQSGQGDLKLDSLLILSAAGSEVDVYSDFDQDEDSYDGCSLVATMSRRDAAELHNWLTTWLARR